MENERSPWKLTRVFKANAAAYLAGKRVICNEGGTSSSKTISILQLLDQIARNTKRRLLISVLSETMPHMKRGCIRDFQNILGDDFDNKRWNKSDFIYTYDNAEFEFLSVDQPGIEIVPDSIIDLTRDQGHVVFSGAEVDAAGIIAEPGQGDAVLEAAKPAILTMVAADMCGAGEWQLQTTADYARQRVQFGRPIGSFQAIKHPIVNMMIMVDAARSLVYNAACAIDHEPDKMLEFARMAKASASDMATFRSGRSIQCHGGIGFTWECFVQLYVKRQMHNKVLYGDAAYHRAKLSEIFFN